MFEGKTLLISGGTGSFGSTVLNLLINEPFAEIRIFSRDEKKQEDQRLHYRDKRLRYYLGDVRDYRSIANAVSGVDYIFHAAALKQVPSCEFHPMEAVKTNVLGTDNLLEAAIHAGVARVVCLSTDKAVYPINANWTHEFSTPTDTIPIPAPGATFDVVFAGNMGPAQDLDVVLAAARLLKVSMPNVRFLMVGDGVDKAILAETARTESLDNMVFLGRLPPRGMPAVFATADALLVQLRDEPVFAITIPSKTQAYLYAGKPILVGVRGDAAYLVAAAGAGFAFEPGNAMALADAVRRMAAMSSVERAEMGRAGAQYYREHLSLEVGVQTFARVFEQAIADTRR